MGQEVAELPGRIQGQVGLLSPAPGPPAHCHRRLQAGQSTCGTWGSGGSPGCPHTGPQGHLLPRDFLLEPSANRGKDMERKARPPAPPSPSLFSWCPHLLSAPPSPSSCSLCPGPDVFLPLHADLEPGADSPARHFCAPPSPLGPPRPHPLYVTHHPLVSRAI